MKGDRRRAVPGLRSGRHHGGASCNPEWDNYEAALHDYQIAFDRLTQRCPWLRT